MIQFDELHITSDGSKLVVECHVEDYDVYKDMYIKTIYVEYYKNRGAPGVPSDKAFLLYENTNDDPTVRSVRKIMSGEYAPSDFGIPSLEGGLFYIYVTCDGTIGAQAAALPCGYDNTLDIGVALDWKFLYGIGMSYVAQFTGCNKCAPSGDFEHFILMWNAIKLSIETCDWVQLEKIWSDMTNTYIGAPGNPGCGCRG